MNVKQSSVQAITPQLRQWIIEQATAGCKPEDVLQSMRDAGWQEDVAIAAMETTLQAHLATQTNPALAAELLAQQAAQRAVQDGIPVAVPVPDADLNNSALYLDAGDRHVHVLSVMKHPRILVLGNMLSDDECDALIAAAKPRLARSLTVSTQTGGEEINADRTSNGMFFPRGDNEVVQRLEARIAKLFSWPLENGEGLQVLHYRPGAEYKPHYDYFDPKEPGTPKILLRGGQRVATVLVYLSEPEKGGGTTFPDVSLEIAPKRGNAVFFSYDKAHPSTKSLHGGAPVIAGEKWIATKWLREREFV
jgi:prolyl 4-hydroxylase